jgi:predicted N-formylglutamate amidohydrolase
MFYYSILLTESDLRKTFVKTGGEMATIALQDDDVVEVVNAAGRSRVVLVCEHASCFIPDHLDHLGLGAADRASHAAWDPGARALAQLLSKSLNARLVASRISRLVYDCNRPPEAPDAMPERSEVIDVPGNRGLTMEERRRRAAVYYEPFRDTLSQVLNATENPIIVTLHSFTPIYHGQRRAVEIGVLHDRDTRLADAMLAQVGDLPFDVQRNAPYGPENGVTHTLITHALPAGHLNVMLEVRNDLIATPSQQAEMAKGIRAWLDRSFAALRTQGQIA